MENFRGLIFAVLLVSFVTFVALFGRLPVLRNTPIGYLHRLLWIHVPNALQAADRRITGGRILHSLSTLGHYLVYEQNPVVLIFFLTLLTGSMILFLATTWFQLNMIHRFFVTFLVPLPFVFTYLCVYSIHSQIRADNHADELSVYPYDYTLYYPGHHCTTCQQIKPARSKHCSICRACVARHDHHCVWVNNCISHDNYRWFLGLLASLSCILPYGAALAYTVLRHMATTRLTRNTTGGFKGIFERGGVILEQDARIGAVGLLAGLTAPLAWGMFGYHVYLIWAGTTTNETMKWDDLKEDMAEGLIYKRIRSPQDSRHETSAAARTLSSWPNSSDQFIFRTYNSQNPLAAEQNLEQDKSAKDMELVRCWHLGDVVNLYDLGFRDNLLDALHLL